MDLKLEANSASVWSYGMNAVTLDIKGADRKEILDHFTTKDIFACVNIGELLNEIGVDHIKDYFNLIDKP